MRISISLLILSLTMAFSLPAQNHTAQDICPILIGDEVPGATLRDTEGNAVPVSEILNQKPTVIMVYRGGWCPYCNRHFSKMGSIEGELKEMGYQMVAISPDTPENLVNTAEKNEVGYALYSDSQLEFIDALGLSFQVDDKTLKKYKMYGINLEKASGEDHHRLPVPAILILDDKGIVQFTYVNPNYKVRAEPQVILAAARAALD